MKASLARVREEHLQRAIAAAREELARKRGLVGYPDVLERLVREALEALGEDAGRVHVDPRDEALVRAMFASGPDRPLVTPDLETAGGVTAESVDGRIRVDNTFDSRLVRAGEVYRRELYDRLIGGRDGPGLHQCPRAGHVQHPARSGRARASSCCPTSTP